MNRQAEFDRVHKIIQQEWELGGFTIQDQNHAQGNNPFTEHLTTVLLNNGIRSKDGFGINFTKKPTPPYFANGIWCKVDPKDYKEEA